MTMRPTAKNLSEYCCLYSDLNLVRAQLTAGGRFARQRKTGLLQGDADKPERGEPELATAGLFRFLVNAAKLINT